jgi:putative ABC transport system permease protein
MEALRQEIERLPGVTSAALSGEVPGDNQNMETAVRKPGSPDRLTINIHNVGYGFFATYGTPLVTGREFSPEHGGDDFAGEGGKPTTKGGNVVLSVNALARFGFATPEAAVGQVLDYEIGQNHETVPATIVGVVGNVQFRSARDELPPTMFFRNSSNFRELTVRYSGVGEAEMRNAVETIWRRLVPGVPFRGDFLTAVVDNQYKAEKAQGTMFTAFAILAVVVACLGLFGLAAFTAERRTKEIGLRKVLGAKVPDIVQLLLWQFSKPVALANLIAWPIAYFVMRNWLNGFEFRISLSPLFFVAAGLVALTVAWLTIVGHAVRVARAKPIIALRYE